MTDADRVVARTTRTDGETRSRWLPLPTCRHRRSSIFDPAYNVVANSDAVVLAPPPVRRAASPGARPDVSRRMAGVPRRERGAWPTPPRPRAAPDATVLVHDYHLALAPAMLRASRPDLRISHFTHTPFVRPGVPVDPARRHRRGTAAGHGRRRRRRVPRAPLGRSVRGCWRARRGTRHLPDPAHLRRPRRGRPRRGRRGQRKRRVRGASWPSSTREIGGCLNASCASTASSRRRTCCAASGRTGRCSRNTRSGAKRSASSRSVIRAASRSRSTSNLHARSRAARPRINERFATRRLDARHSRHQRRLSALGRRAAQRRCVAGESDSRRAQPRRVRGRRRSTNATPRSCCRAKPARGTNSARRARSS